MTYVETGANSVTEVEFDVAVVLLLLLSREQASTAVDNVMLDERVARSCRLVDEAVGTIHGEWMRERLGEGGSDGIAI
jgi:hypothetical protein